VAIYEHFIVASDNQRLPTPGQCSTHHEHMPAAHRRYAEWSPARIIAWGRSVGPHTAQLAELILTQRPHPEQGGRSCLGLLRLSQAYGHERMEAACARAIALGTHSYRSVQSILQHHLDQVKPELPTAAGTATHENIRGADYYAQGDDEPC
jgi:transposase